MEMGKKLSLEELNDFINNNSNEKVNVIKYVGKINGNHRYQVECNICHKVWDMQKDSIKYGKGCKSCSHMNNDYDEVRLKYNLSVKDIASLVIRHVSMIGRCYNTNDINYYDYGGRAKPITVCDEWKNSKVSYIDYLCSIGWKHGSKLQMDRINNDGNYEPSNIRLVSNTVNNLNRRNNNGHSLIYEINNNKTNPFQLQIPKIGYSKYFPTLSDAITARDKLIVEYRLVDYYELLNT